MISLARLADELGLAVEGEGAVELRGVASLEDAEAGDLAFARGPAFAQALAATRAGAVIAPPDLDTGGRPTLRSQQPGRDFARAVRRIVPEARLPVGVDDTARVDPQARVDARAAVGPGCVVGAGAEVGAGSQLLAGVVLYPGVVVGADCLLHAGCRLGPGTRLGDRVILQASVALGFDGFGYVADERGAPEKVPQVGRVVVGDDVEIGANSTVDRGSLGDTVIGRNTKIDNLVHVAHNCRIGEDVLIAAQVGLAGSTVIERGAILMGQVGVAGHLTIGERAFVGAKCGVHSDVPAGARVWGVPQREERSWHRVTAALTRLPDLFKRVRDIERKLGLRGGPEEPGG